MFPIICGFRVEERTLNDSETTYMIRVAIYSSELRGAGVGVRAGDTN